VAGKEDLDDPLDKIPYNLNFMDTTDLHYQSVTSEESFDYNNNFDSEVDFVDLYDGVSYGSDDEWMSGLELDDDEPTILSSQPDSSNDTCRHASNLKRGYKYVEHGIEEATINARVKIWLTATEWTTIRVVVNGTSNIPSDASRNVLMGYQ
jgi:hypothetical protein